MNENSYETSIDVLRQLFDFDDSREFRFIIKLINQTNMYENIKDANLTCFTGISEHFHNLVIRTTINKARAISSRINRIYQSDPLIDVLFINLDFSQLNSPNDAINDTNIKQFEKKIIEFLNCSLNQ